jgi:alkaline phosphatase D
MMLNLEGIPRNDGHYDLRLSVWAHRSGELLAAQELTGIPAERLRGNVALVAHPAGQDVRYIFESFKVGGGRFEHHPERTFGPIAGTLYSLSGDTLKMGVQFMHLGEAIGKKGKRLAARLEVRSEGNEEDWKIVAGPKAISPPDYYVSFRVEGWDSSCDRETRVVFQDADGKTYTYRTRIHRDPVDKSVVSLAAFTGMGVMGRTAHARGPKPKEGEIVVGRWTPANVWMPFAEAVRAVKEQDVDILFFTGDQIYEGKPSPKDRSRTPFEDYLYKWLLWHWSFRELTDHLPAIVQPDDHDVYHGNLWGWGGRLCLTNRNSDGGFLTSPYFVNMVYRTQTAHNPDPYDPAPALNGIRNYYYAFTYGGVGFAVLEDRKFKTPPKIQDPAEQVLLGERQLRFLKEWGEDWKGQKFKVVVSQTVYAAMHVNFNGELARDPDTNGFPKVGRDRAVRLFRRCGALVVCGDQHLSTFARLGIERPSDAVYQFSVPALANIWWRWFYPNMPGKDRKPGEPDYLGEFTDAWGNYFRMIAVANPERRELLGQRLRQRHLIPLEEAKEGKGDTYRACLGDGYGIVRFDKIQGRITIECWPHNADPADGNQQFPGWPITLKLEELDGRKPIAWLPDLRIEEIADPVVQIVDQTTGEVIKITRARKGFYRPGVFDADKVYTLRVGEPGLTDWWEARDLRPSSKPGETSLEVRLRKL